MKLTVKEILNICDGTLLCGDDSLSIESFSKDTRTINIGDCYLGIKGENFDGNLFWKEAKEKGAISCILDSFQGDLDNEDYTIILVEDTLQALQKLAHYVRNKKDIPVIAITGSAGKTSTKDLISSVLSMKYKVLKTPGNLNGQIGLPLTILQYKDEDMIVLEMGMNDFGQIETLSNIANPNISVITNVGSAHIGILGSRENILKAKLEIIKGMNEGTLIYNGDNDMLKTISNLKQKKITFGLENNNDYVATNIKMKNGKTYFEYKNELFEIPILGEVFVYNALAAIIIGNMFDLTLNEIKEGIKNCSFSGNRMEIIETKKYTIINDTYNANLEAMKSAISILSTFDNRKVAILGDMLELGEYEKEIHEELGSFLNGKIDFLITIGSRAIHIDKKFNGEKVHYEDLEETKKEIKSYLLEDDIILIKASQGMKLFELVAYLKN